MIDNKNTPMICGIDTIYYFIETNRKYDAFFQNIEEQIENKKIDFEKQEIEYKNSDICIKINGITMQYLNKAEGFHWFRDTNEFFRLGFKDNLTNFTLHNVRVQLQGIGIYTLGLKALLSFINDNLLKEIKTGKFPITRADINCFVNHDFGCVDKTMFVSRKRNYQTISEIGDSKEIQTIYVGKKPFRLRLYNKRLELKKSVKKDMMYEYFSSNGLDVKKPIFNLEFEMLRTHLRAHNINTLEDLLFNANSLFKKAMKDIRLIDINTITQKDIKNNSKNRATTLPIWQYVNDNFNIETFLQNEFSIKRLKQKSYLYNEDKFIEEFNNLIQKALVYKIYISVDFISAITQNFLNEKKL